MAATIRFSARVPWAAGSVAGFGINPAPYFAKTALQSGFRRSWARRSEAILAVGTDPRVRAFHESAEKLMAELEAEGANF